MKMSKKEQVLAFWLLAILTAIVAVFLLAWNASAASLTRIEDFCLPTYGRDASRSVECQEIAATVPDYCLLAVVPLTNADPRMATCVSKGIPANCVPSASNSIKDEACAKKYEQLIRCSTGTSILFDACMTPDGGIWGILRLVLQILTMGVGVLAVLGFVIAAIIYTTAGGDENKVRLAKTMIFNIAIGLVMYVLLYALVNFILPGNVSGNSCQDMKNNGATDSELMSAGCEKNPDTGQWSLSKPTP